MACLLQEPCKVVNHFSDNLMVEKRLLSLTYKTSVYTIRAFCCWDRCDMRHQTADEAYFVGCGQFV